jgi:hypothetical protein
MVGNEGFEHLTSDHIIFDLETKCIVNNFRMTVDLHYRSRGIAILIYHIEIE